MMNAPHGRSPRVIVIVPCLNEVAHMDNIIAQFTPVVQDLDARLVIVDGGSTDGTREIVRNAAQINPRIAFLHNPRRLQSAAVNRAVQYFGDSGIDYLIRIDAHADYPPDYCRVLVEEAVATGADSVVVAVATTGKSLFQKAVACAQNSKLGNGGSKHRQGAAGHWIDHGHHALMRVVAFSDVGGYDETFSHNEDAELDFRLTSAGYRIWMTDRTVMTYYPRSSVVSLFRQYLGYGRGRARNVLKHGIIPKLRQLIPLAVVPVIAGASLAFLSWAAFVPAGVWMVACFGYGVWMAIGQRNPLGPLAAFAAMVMHVGWSMGFWIQLLDFRQRRRMSP